MEQPRSMQKLRRRLLGIALLFSLPSPRASAFSGAVCGTTFPRRVPLLTRMHPSSRAPLAASLLHGSASSPSLRCLHRRQQVRRLPEQSASPASRPSPLSQPESSPSSGPWRACCGPQKQRTTCWPSRCRQRQVPPRTRQPLSRASSRPAGRNPSCSGSSSCQASSWGPVERWTFSCGKLRDEYCVGFGGKSLLRVRFGEVIGGGHSAGYEARRRRGMDTAVAECRNLRGAEV